jgi:dTDP-glucose 4,6-dehydratase
VASGKDEDRATLSRLDPAVCHHGIVVTLLVTGGAVHWVSSRCASGCEPWPTCRYLDALTYAACLDNVASVADDPALFVCEPICGIVVRWTKCSLKYAPTRVLHLAARSIDRSIDGPAGCKTNVMGTFHLLEAARAHWDAKAATVVPSCVHWQKCFGSLGATGQFTETTPYDPTSTYSSSKAASDHWCGRGMKPVPVCTTNCSNNFWPVSFP